MLIDVPYMEKMHFLGFQEIPANSQGVEIALASIDKYAFLIDKNIQFKILCFFSPTIKNPIGGHLGHNYDMLNTCFGFGPSLYVLLQV